MENTKEMPDTNKLNVLINIALDNNLKLKQLYELCTKNAKEKAKVVLKHQKEDQQREKLRAEEYAFEQDNK